MAIDGVTNNNNGGKAHVLLVPFPGQGHINPMLQFGKRLTAYGLRATLAVTRNSIASAKSTTTEVGEVGEVAVEPISDGCDYGSTQPDTFQAYLDRLELFGSASLAELIRSQQAEGRPIRALVYDGFVLWALEVGKRFGLVCVAFFTQSCAVNLVYWHVVQGRVEVPWSGPELVASGLTRMEPRDVPSFVREPDRSAYPAYYHMLKNLKRFVKHRRRRFLE